MNAQATPATTPGLLHIQGVTKSYPSGFALGPLDLAIAAGSTVGLVGKNGAGKTTTFQLLTGNMDASGGEIRIASQKLSPDNAALKRTIGYLPQDPTLPQWATAHEVLLYAAQLYGLTNARQCVEAAEQQWDCASYRSKPLATLSYGMQKRVGLALATLHDPALLILDEPFSGLDLNHIKTLEQAISGRAAAGKSTILSTHVLSFCARLCSEVLILSAGRLIPVTPWQGLAPVEREAAIEAKFFTAEGEQ